MIQNRFVCNFIYYFAVDAAVAIAVAVADVSLAIICLLGDVTEFSVDVGHHYITLISYDMLVV